MKLALARCIRVFGRQRWTLLKCSLKATDAYNTLWTQKNTQKTLLPMLIELSGF